VFFGENPLAAYGGPLDRQAEQCMTRAWTAEYGGYLGMRPSDFVGMEGITEKDMRAYEGPDDEELSKAGIKAYFLGQFLPWDSHRNLSVAVAHGFESVLPCNANWWWGENLDSAQTGAHDVLMLRKYGYGRACAQLSVDIRAELLTREKAKTLLDVREASAGDLPASYAGVSREAMLDQIGMSLKRFNEILDDYTGESRH